MLSCQYVEKELVHGAEEHKKLLAHSRKRRSKVEGATVWSMLMAVAMSSTVFVVLDSEVLHF